MDELLYKTKNLMSEGLFNSVASRTNEKIREEIEKLYNKMLNENYLKLESNIRHVIVKLKIKESPTIINQNIDEFRENLVQNIFKLLEEILYSSKKQIKSETKNKISSIQTAIENMYKEEYTEILLNISIGALKEISIIKKELRNEKNKETWFGCDKEIGEINRDDIIQLLYAFSSKCYVEIYSMKKSYEIINQNLKTQLLGIIKEGIDEIIKNENLKKELEETIKKKTEEQAKILMDIFDKEIREAFPKYD